MHILMTGSHGYIGKHFMDITRDRYRFSTFSLQRDMIERVKLDGIDAVVHCAALVHQKEKKGLEEYIKINTEYPVVLAKKAKKHGVKHFVFLSTVAVYSDANNRIDETTDLNPATPYGISKLEAENQLRELEDEGFIISIIRPPMVYGKGAPGNIASLIKLVFMMPVLPLGGIGNRRSFVYIGNLVALIDKILEQRKSGIFLASDDRPLSTTQLIAKIANALGKKVYLVKIPLFESILKRLKPSFHQRLFGSLEIDNTQTKKILGFKNPYSTEEGIRYMIEGEKV